MLICVGTHDVRLGDSVGHADLDGCLFMRPSCPAVPQGHFEFAEPFRNL